MILSESAIFIEKTTVEHRLWAKSEFLWAKNASSLYAAANQIMQRHMTTRPPLPPLLAPPPLHQQETGNAPC